MTTTLPLFWHLSSSQKKERLDASVKLIGALEQFQAQFVPKYAEQSEDSEDSESGEEVDEDENEDKEAATKSDKLDVLNAQDVSYSIRRLVRGLASPRESSRLGFAVALTELLSRLDTVTCSQIVNLILDGTKLQGSMSGQEERDVLFARLFGFTSVIQSGLLVRTTPVPTSGSAAPQASTSASFTQIITELVALGEKKSWLRESAWWSLSLAMDALKNSEVPWKDEALESSLQTLFVENTTWSPEKLGVGLKLQAEYSEKDWKKLFSPGFKNPDLLASSNLQNIAKILKEASFDDDDSKDLATAAAGTWKPQLHFAWSIILEQLLPSPDSHKKPRGSFQEFFRIAVDESLFSSTASDERKYWGFQAFQQALPRMNQENMAMLFTKNFMRTWINHLSHQDRYLHKIARQTASEVQSFVQKNPQLGFALILQLTGVNGSNQFDKLTKTKTVEGILTSMNADGIKEYIHNLLEQVNGSSDDIQALNTRRSWVIDQLGSLIRNGAVPKNDEWVQTVLNWFTVHGLFIIKKKSEKSPIHEIRTAPSPTLSDEHRAACRSRLLSSLGDLSANVTLVSSGEKSAKISAVASDGEFWVAKVLKTITVLEKDTKHVSLLLEPEEEDVALRAKALSLIERLKTVTGDKQDTARGTQLLLLATVLEQYCMGEDEDGDTEALESSIDAVSRMFPEDKKGKKSRKSKGTDEDAEAEPVDVIVDTIIGFLEKSTAYMRTIGNQVFTLISGAVQESTVDLLISQLERRDPSQLLADEDEEMEDLSDVEGDEAEDDEESESSEDENPEDDEDSNDEEEDVELRKRIEEALAANGIQAAGDESEEEELLDDDQMMAIDEQLAAVFRTRVNERKKGKDVDAQREATHFKNRVLDLVDIFLKKQPTSPLVVRLILPLVDLVARSTKDERQLSDKARGILNSRISKAKEIPTEVDEDILVAIAKDLHERARKAHSSAILPLLSQCSTYLAKLVIHLGSDAVTDLYKASLADFVTRKQSGLNTAFFQDFIRRFPAQAWKFRSDLVELSEKAVNVYRRCQSIQLIETLVTQLPAMGDASSAEVLEYMQTLNNMLLKLATEVCNDTITLNSTQFKDLLKVALQAVRHTQRIDSASVSKVWQSSAWNSVNEKLANSRFKQSPALKKMCEQIVRLARPTDQTSKAEKAKPKGAKRKAEQVGEEESSGQKPKMKRKRAKVTES